MKVQLSALSFMLLLHVALLGCTSPEPPEGDGIVTLKIGAIPVAECAILLNDAVFARHNIRVEIHTAQSGTIISDGVIGGGLEAGFSNLVTPIIANSRRIPLRILGPISIEDEQRARHNLVVRTGSGIKAPGDLRGRTVALNSLKNIDHLMLLRWLGEASVEEAGIEIRTVGFPNMLSTLAGSGVDGVALVEPFVTAARSNPSDFTLLGNYFASRSGGPTAVSGFVVREDWIRKNARVASNLAAALREAAEEAANDPEGFRSDVASISRSDAATVAEMPLPWYKLGDYAEEVAELASVARRYGFIESEVVAETIIYQGE